MVHQVLANDRFWSGQPRSITQRYDRLVADPVDRRRGAGRSPGPDLEARRGRRGRLRIFVPGQPPADDGTGPTTPEGRDRPGRPVDRPGARPPDPPALEPHEGGPGGRLARAGDPQAAAALARICGRWLEAHGYEPDDRSEIASALRGEPDRPFEAIRWELAMARGAVACPLRCLSLRHPRLARSIKPFLGIAPEAPLARPAPVALPANIRLDGKGEIPAPPPARQDSGRDPRGRVTGPADEWHLDFRKRFAENGIGNRRRSGSDGGWSSSLHQPGAERCDCPPTDTSAIRSMPSAASSSRRAASPSPTSSPPTASTRPSARSRRPGTTGSTPRW